MRGFSLVLMGIYMCNWFQESERAVSKEEGMDLAKQHGFLFLESSAKTRENVEKCFEELALKVLFQITQNVC